MEAEVHACGPDAVLKLYDGTARLTDLLTLQGFYDSLDRRLVPYALPRIHTVVRRGRFVVVVERRLAGTRLSETLPALTREQLEAVMERYLSAALAVSRFKASPELDRYKLLDPDCISQQSKGDWNRFLSRYLDHKLTQVGCYLCSDVPEFDAKTQQLQEILVPPYGGDYCLVHGDFFPGNLLVDDDGQITALLDFGLLTMWGDRLLDIATGWAFFDMYDELGVRATDRYLGFVLDRLGEGVRGKLYRYVLVYSILSANTYSPDCRDGHYAWCVANLSNPHYWKRIE